MEHINNGEVFEGDGSKKHAYTLKRKVRKSDTHRTYLRQKWQNKRASNISNKRV